MVVQIAWTRRIFSPLGRPADFFCEANNLETAKSTQFCIGLSNNRVVTDYWAIFYAARANNAFNR